MNNELFSNKEKRVLIKFKQANIVSKEDEKILNRYASIGFVCFSFNWDIMKEVATLTKLGSDHLNKYR